MTAQRRQRAWGDGTAYKRSDGRWTAQIFVTESVSGKRVRRTLYGRTRKDVETKMRELRDMDAQGAPIPPTDLTLETYLKEWLSQVVAVRVRANTLAAYRFNVERYLVPGLGQKRLGRLTARDVRLYLDSLRQMEAGPRTIQYVHATLRAALEDAVREEIIPKNVAKLVRVPRPPKTDRPPLTAEEIRMLLKSERDFRTFAMSVMFAVLGMRRSEVLGLRWEDVDLEVGFLQIRRGLQRIDGELRVLDTKTARSRRTIPLPNLVIEALKDQQNYQETDRWLLGQKWPDSGFVFTTPIGTPIDPANCTKMIQAACKRAGLRTVRLHDFRHGCVSVLLDLGVPPRTVMEIVGHTTLEMTMNVYGHVTLDAKRAALGKLGDLLDEDKE